MWYSYLQHLLYEDKGHIQTLVDKNVPQKWPIFSLRILKKKVYKNSKTTKLAKNNNFVQNKKNKNKK